MPVFTKDQYRVLYVHVPKTGGTAIELFFERNGWDVALMDRGGRSPLAPMLKCTPQHLHGVVLRELFHLNEFTYIFMTVRHPVARLVSEYRMRSVLNDSIAPIDVWLDEALTECAANPYASDNHLRPQVEFWLPGCEVFRQEEGFAAAWVDKLAERIGCGFHHRAVEVAMRFPAAARVSPSAASLRRIAAFYAKDLQLFGYAMPATD